jgi:hypothetical protein
LAEARLEGYWTTEQHVPYTSDYIEAVRRVYKIKRVSEKKMGSVQDHDINNRFQLGPTPFDPVRDTVILRDAVAKDLKLTVGELMNKIAALKKARTPEDFDAASVCGGDVSTALPEGAIRAAPDLANPRPFSGRDRLKVDTKRPVKAHGEEVTESKGKCKTSLPNPKGHKSDRQSKPKPEKVEQRRTSGTPVPMPARRKK